MPAHRDPCFPPAQYLMSRVRIPSSPARSIIRNTGWERRQRVNTAEVQDTDFRAVQNLSNIMNSSSHEKARLVPCFRERLNGFKKHIQCAIAFAQVKRKYLIMFVFSFFLQILAWKKEKKWGFFFDDMISPYDNAHIYFFSSEDSQCKYSLFSDFRKYYIDFLGEAKSPRTDLDIMARLIHGRLRPL